MKSIIKGLLLVTALTLPLASFAADGDNLETKVNDSVITTKVKAIFATDDLVEATDIKVETDSNGMVELSGTANSEAEAEKAVRLTKSVEGVTSVKDSIEVINE